MATTTNFGWTTPNDTDLVKNGAAAIRTLGSAVDTSLAQLKGGTTGQVLSKTSNTDMAFTWVAQDDSNAIQNALLTTTGDTIYASSASTPARLAIGSSGQALTVVAGVPSWAASATSVLTTTGDLLYASAANTLARRAIGTTGQVLTVSGGVPTWATPAAGSFVGVRVKDITTAQTISTGTDTEITWTGTESFDTDGFHSGSTNTARLTVPAGKAGYYKIYGNASFNPATTGRRAFGIKFNGTTQIVAAEISPDSTNYPTASMSTTFYLDVGDYVSLWVYHERGSNLGAMGNASLAFGMEKIG